MGVYGNNGGLDLLISWNATTSSQKDNSTTPANAKACQNLCSKHTGCNFFTYNDGGASGGSYGYFRGLCFLQKALTCNGTNKNYVVHQNAIPRRHWSAMGTTCSWHGCSASL